MLLSFVANESVQQGSVVVVLDNPLGRINNSDPLTYANSRCVGIAVDTVSSGGLCRVVSKGEADFFTGLIPGSLYYAPLSGTFPVNYSEFASIFQTLTASGAYLCALGKAISPTTLSVNLSTPLLVQKDSLD